ncbi:hypothetical protein E1295_35845 [Nonomuraea mesophila]|uniref:Uncharacterized protein n=1 Tax=Nonomuraea mesophila TaxID=2530382 RepID=A0A4V2Z799_9ACTN|nr:hypothetical protein [Nonomuraea mesophila]TDE35736.1 hypothetical protein E1295_35845 [Nonomuraea mesophila]
MSLGSTPAARARPRRDGGPGQGAGEASAGAAGERIEISVRPAMPGAGGRTGSYQQDDGVLPW